MEVVLAPVGLRRSLLDWYDRSGRDLPWRQRTDPYAIWISEIMLQQTRVTTVIPYYHRWLARFPTVEALAVADLQDILKLWEGLGYYARARNVHKAARQILDEYNGVFPRDLDSVMALAGIGRSTAGGILSLAFNAPISILDGNVKRVYSRLIALEVPPSKALRRLWSVSDRYLDPDNPRDFNQALMDLGATVCTRHDPNCLLCPWRESCKAYNQGIQSVIPMREESNPIPYKKIGVAVIRDDRGLILIDRRPEKGLLGGLWEFPGGKIEPGETVQECIQREIREEIGIEIEVADHLTTIDHAYSHFRVNLQVYNCRYLRGEPRAIECEEVRWVSLAEIENYPFPKANLQIIEALKARVT